MGFDEAAFNKDIKDLHLIYDYDAKNVETGEPEKWKYEMWFYSKVCSLVDEELVLSFSDLRIDAHSVRYTRRPHGRTQELSDC